MVCVWSIYNFVGLDKTWRLSCDGWIMYFPMLCQMDAYSNFLIKQGCDIWIKELWLEIPYVAVTTLAVLKTNSVQAGAELGQAQPQLW